MKKGSFVAVVLIAAICLLHFTPEAGGATRAPTANEPNTYTITIQNFMFSPQKLEVPANAKVTWINKDEEPHTVVEVQNVFASHALDTDETFTYRFAKAGTYTFFCTLHPRMTGTLVVEAK
jgi:plastocyanin